MATAGHNLNLPTRRATSSEAPLPPQARPRDDLFCPQCGYNLRGLSGRRCPECGYSVQTTGFPVSGIPWVFRGELGWFRAYWKTVSFVLFRQHRFCDEIARPVSYADSQSFRRVTVFHAYTPILLGTIALYALEPANLFGRGFVGDLWAEVWPVAVLHMGLLIFLAAATGVPSYFFHPRGTPVYLQNRAIALSYYACGSLCVVSLPVALGLIPAVFDVPERLAIICLLAAVLVLIAQVVGWWLDLVRVSRRLVSHRPGWADLVAVCLPLLWAILAGLIFVVLPIGVLYVVVVIHSLG